MLLPLPGIETESSIIHPADWAFPAAWLKITMPKNPLTISWDECRHHHLLLEICHPNTFSLKSFYITWPRTLLSDMRCLQLRPCVASLHNWRHNVTSGANLITTFTLRNCYLGDNFVSLAVKYLWYSTTYDHVYDLTKQQKLVTDVSCLISDMSRYLCVFHSRANFMQDMHKYELPPCCGTIHIDLSKRQVCCIHFTGWQGELRAFRICKWIHFV